MSAIDDKYNSLIHADPWIGSATTPESVCPDHVGHYRHYQGGASIYWTPTTAAHLIYGAIRNKWAALGWERGPNRYPTTDESEAMKNLGRYNGFQDGTIVWKNGASQAFSVHGAIVGKWWALGGEGGWLGFPQTDETGTPDGIGRFNHFENGSIYWSPSTGAWSVNGAIRDKWASLGWERGGMGYPTSDEHDTPGVPGGRTSNFQGGSISWTPRGGAVVHRNTLSTTWHWGDFSAGKIDVHQMTLTIFSNGAWTWTASLHDNSTFYGDNYAIGWAFKGLGHGAATTGSLGAKLSGPPVDGSVNMSGTDTWLADNYFLCVAKGVQANLHVSGDLGQLFDGLWNDLKAIGGAVLKALASGNGTGGDDPNGGDDGGDDGGDTGESEDALKTRILHLSIASGAVQHDIKLDPHAVPQSAMAPLARVSVAESAALTSGTLVTSHP